ncbi:hypothetical protein K7X08_019154 [Anisodus acutangulus]|uniref:Uncharacterized protein n=1 Tax=Anisodus acutangulus TaxID=402998 RepID=A0A9Q1MUF8_9SOLA|nr:hypothetical protein K7X08_019154 [Anisodus acutangulus]
MVSSFSVEPHFCVTAATALQNEERECRVTIEPDGDNDASFSCLPEENGTDNLRFFPASFIFEDSTTSCN